MSQEYEKEFIYIIQEQSQLFLSRFPKSGVIMDRIPVQVEYSKIDCCRKLVSIKFSLVSGNGLYQLEIDYVSTWERNKNKKEKIEDLIGKLYSGNTGGIAEPITLKRVLIDEEIYNNKIKRPEYGLTLNLLRNNT